ncbi:MAG: nuclear transport factor 2 family protein, partial [Halieaceae bacterium]|nr:nuclear transport factor 2 family protein [Halieaceae bacterium]
MEQAVQVFMDYAAAFEETYVDDDWSRLTPLFHENARYEVRGGPMACDIAGRDAIFTGLKKSIDGLDRRFADRTIEISDGPHVTKLTDGEEVNIGWLVSYRREGAPTLSIPGRSVFKVVDGRIAAMRDEYDDTAMAPVGAWLQQYGAGLDGSYV